MPVTEDGRNFPNDRFGYSVYTVVALATPEQIAKVNAVRTAIGLTRATIDAHVTVRGTFSNIESLDEMRDLLRRTVSENSTLPVEFSSGGWLFRMNKNGLHAGMMLCETTDGLLALNAAFDAVIRPRSKNLYSDTYRAHLTLCQDCTEKQIEQARSLAAELDIGNGFDVRSVQLMGRVGPAFGGEWKLIESFPISG